MTIDDIKKLDNRDLLDLYANLVEIDFYDAFETPARIQELRNSNINQNDLRKIILERMK